MSNEEIMLRTLLIYLSKAVWAQRLVTRWKFAWLVASRFVAGRSIQDAVKVVQELNKRGINATLDTLGENTETGEEAEKATNDILLLLDQINTNQIKANVSVKLTQIGLALDEGLCAKNLERILARARKHNNFVRIDMEDTPYTDKTLRVFQHMQQKGYVNVGVVLQAYLYRSEKDAREMLVMGTHIRLVKGAYQEPPELAFPKKFDVDANFDLLSQVMIDGAIQAGAPLVSKDGYIPPIPAIGTHDPKRIQFAINYAEKVGLSKQAIEFQMLYGIRRDLQEQCVKQGYPLRIYVPYGSHWYPYFMRRLAERPANLWFFVSNFFRK
jgi:proline dehydrogenase